jgi:hypothetical protein
MSNAQSQSLAHTRPSRIRNLKTKKVEFEISKLKSRIRNLERLKSRIRKLKTQKSNSKTQNSGSKNRLLQTQQRTTSKEEQVRLKKWQTAPDQFFCVFGFSDHENRARRRRDVVT